LAGGNLSALCLLRQTTFSFVLKMNGKWLLYSF